MKTTGTRQVRSKGRFGVAYGGLNGDGDIVLTMKPESARAKLLDSFSEMLSAQGQLVRTQFITIAEARAMMVDVERQLDGWREMVDGDCLDVVVPVRGLTTLRVGIFRCFYGYQDRPSMWWIPNEVRLDGTNRHAYDAHDGEVKQMRSRR